MFLVGFDFAALLVYTICEEESAFPPEGNIGMAVGAGVLVGLVSTNLPLFIVFDFDNRYLIDSI